MKTFTKFAVIASAIIGVNFYYAFAHSALSTAKENAESLSNATMSSKTGIPIVRYEKAGETATAIIINEITTCMPGLNKACYAGTQTIYQRKPNL